MKRILFALIALSLVLVPAVAVAAPLPQEFYEKRLEAIASQQPYAILVVEQRVIDLSGAFQPGPNSDRLLLSVDLTQFGIGQSVVEAEVSGSLARGGAGPFITFGATTTNLVAGPITYTFLFGTPVTPDNYTNATSTGGVSVTNGVSGTTTVSNSAVHPTYISGRGTLAAVPTNLGVDNGTGAVIASGAPFQVTTTRAFGTLANSFAPTNFDGLEAQLTYTQDDVSSVASWSGAVTMDVPEPTTSAALIFACGAIVMRRRNVR